MKICQIPPIYLPGALPGCSKYVQDISENLAKKGHDVTLLTGDAITGRGWVDPLFGKYAPEEEEVIGGVRVRRLKTRWQVTAPMVILREGFGRLLPASLKNYVALFSAGPYLADFEEEFQEGDYEIIHVTAFPFAIVWLVWKACRSLKRPFICTPLIHFEDPLHRNPLLWEALGRAHSVIACSNYEREQMIRRGIKASQIHLVPMGIRLEDWAGAKGERFRKKYDLGEKKVVLFAGTKNHNKGAFHLLQAVKRVREEIKDIVLVALGLSTPEWIRERSRHPKEELLDLGYVSDEEKRDAFDACDLFVMPSRFDSYGIVYLEAWRCGKPVIGANIGAIPEVIEDGKDGLLVEFGNVSQLASTMARLLDDPALCQEMGDAGKRKVLERLNWDKSLPRIEKVYAQVPS